MLKPPECPPDQQGLPCEFVQIKGPTTASTTGVAVSAEFAGKPKVRRLSGLCHARAADG
ncbi:MAG: hypothetical protein R3E34_02765 [Rhodocyclaceae bacterium]